MLAPVWQGFFWTRSNTHAHSGIDLGMPVGTPIVAPMDGTIISGTGPQRWGGQVNELVRIGGQPYVLTWIHLSREAVKPGPVKAGTVVGYSGTPPAGYGSGSHTHFEVTHGTVAPYTGYNPWNPTASTYPVNPAPFLAIWKLGEAITSISGGQPKSGGGVGGVANSVIGTGGVYNPSGQQDPGAGGSSGDCRHSIGWSGGPGGVGAFNVCMDPALDLAARAALLGGAAVLVVMALIIFAGGNASVRDSIKKTASLAATAV